MSNLKDYVQDLVKNVISTGFFDKIRITASTTEITVDAMEANKDIVMKGKFNAPLADIKGSFGLSNLSLLSNITGDPEYNSDDSTLGPKYDSADQLEEFTYVNKSKSYINYRCMSAKLLPDQPKFAEPKWDVVIKPSKSSVQQFSWASAGLSAYEQYFTPKIVNGELKFFIGEEDGSNQRGGVVFASGLTEKFDCQHKWKISLMQPVLKLADSTECEMAFSVKGAIQVTVNTGIGVYKFIFPSKVN